MALQHSDLPKAGIMAELSRDEQPQTDRAYTIAKIEFMLENYHALLTKRALPPQEKEIMSGVVTIHSQWWNAQRFWEKVAKRADLKEAIEWATKSDARARLLFQFRFLDDPHDAMTWEEVAAALGSSRRTVGRIYVNALNDMAWYLSGKLDK